MRDKRFDTIPGAVALEKAITEAKCPEQFFGMPDEANLDVTALIEKRTQEFNSVTGENSEGADGNADDRLRRLKRMFPVMVKWAREKIAANEYGNMTTYRAKIVFAVKEHEGQKLFHLEEVPDTHLYMENISAGLFEGYDRMDPVLIRKGGQTITGLVNYYGTHGAQEMFRLGVNSPHIPYIEVEDYEIGDTVEIETTSYASIEAYAGVLIRMYVEDLPSEVDTVMDEMRKGKEGDWNDAKIVQVLREPASEKTFVLKEY